MMKGENQLLDELLNSDAVQTVISTARQYRQVPIYPLRFPDQEEVRREAYHWAEALFTNTRFDDARPIPQVYENRIVLSHPDGYRVRGFFASNWLDFSFLRRTYKEVAEELSQEAADQRIRELSLQHELWPSVTERELVIDRMYHTQGRGSSLENNTTQTRLINSIIAYQRLTEGIRWIGPGSRILATLTGRNVIGIDRPWRLVEPKKVATVEIRGLEEALSQMLDGMAARYGRLPSRGMLRIDRVEFGYYAQGRHMFQRFLQPAYQIYMRTTGEAAAGLVEVLAAHSQDIEPFGPEATSPQINQKPRGNE